jgi:hypothetical protein
MSVMLQSLVEANEQQPVPCSALQAVNVQSGYPPRS